MKKLIEYSDLRSMGADYLQLEAYSSSDPLSIVLESNGTYTVSGIIDQKDCTAADVLSILDEIASWQEYRIKEDCLSHFGPFVDVDYIVKADEIRTLAREWQKSIEEVMDELEVM